MEKLKVSSKYGTKLTFAETKVFNQDASHGLSHEELVYNLNKIHPRIIQYDNQTKKNIYIEHAVCGTNTGISCCGKTSRQSEFAPYGVGIVLYFQFLKFIALVLFFATLMSIPSYIFYFSGNSSALQQKNAKSILTAFSLGNIGQSQYACNSGQYNNQSQGNITLFCSFGTLDSITLFGQSLLAQNGSCQNDGVNIKYSPPSCNIDKFTDAQQDSIDVAFADQCKGNTTCNFLFDNTILPQTNCLISQPQSSYIYFVQAACKADEIDLLLRNNIFLTKEKVALIIVLLDIAICYVLYFSFQLLRTMQLATNQEILMRICRVLLRSTPNLANHEKLCRQSGGTALQIFFKAINSIQRQTFRYVPY
ncbi:hypothetical protein FGO68_gene10021 [Halteria grandinella]|uniref:Uncharacterized protein n=1 Tax=Halteria grandinella TaxID=5974 RepID=A0A8J8T9E2_HALGN|nr:hypothetical protein FGO68_gene10021 [Halteria grandinella]